MSLSKKFLRRVKNELKQNVFAQKKGLKRKVFAQSKK